VARMLTVFEDCNKGHYQKASITNKEASHGANVLQSKGAVHRWRRVWRICFIIIRLDWIVFARFIAILLFALSVFASSFLVFVHFGLILPSHLT
jgi:hypothetical protein